MGKPTDEPTALVQIKMEFGSVGYCGSRKTEEPGENPLENKLNPRGPTTNSTHEYGTRTRVTKVDGERLSNAPTMLPLYAIWVPDVVPTALESTNVIITSFFNSSRGRERPGDRPRERDLRHPPPGPDYHRRLSPIPQGPRRSPPHGPPRGRSPHRYDERRRSLSPGGRRDDGYRQGPPRDQGGFGVGRDPMRGRGAYSTPFDNRGRPLENRRRMSPPPRQYAERGRAGLRGRGGGGGGRGKRN